MDASATGRHTRLEVWQRAMDLAEDVYRVARTLPEHERYGLAAQIRRAAVSVPANIAEGAARSTSREFVRFLRISLGSLAELETELLLAARVGIVQSTDVPHDRIVAVRQMLIRLNQSLARKLI